MSLDASASVAEFKFDPLWYLTNGGGPSRLQVLDGLFEYVDRFGEPTWTYDNLHQIAIKDVKWLAKAGLLWEGERARRIVALGCKSELPLKPRWVRHRITGERFGLCKCRACRTTHRFLPDQMRNWTSSFEAVARFLARAMECSYEMLDRPYLASLGEKDGCGILLVRGLRQNLNVLFETGPLRDTRDALVLTLDMIPPKHLWPLGWRQVLKVQDYIRLAGDEASWSFSMPARRSHLLRQDHAVLEALTQSRKPLRLVDVEVAVEISRHTAIRSLRRLMQLGLTERVPGTSRKGFIPTMAGRRFREEIGDR